MRKAHSLQDEQNACAAALCCSGPKTPEALVTLKVGMQSKVEVVRAAVEEQLKKESLATR